MLKQKAWKYIFLALIILAPAFLFFQHAYDFLSFTRSVKAEILLVEGWLSDETLEKAKEEFLQKKYSMILTTGFPYDEGVLIGSDGRMEFRIDRKIDPPADDLYSIGILVRGTKSRGQFPHIILYADSTRLGDLFTSRKKKLYKYTVRLDSSPRIVYAEFDNDTYTNYSDRNLYFYSVTVNGHLFPANRENVLYYARENGKYFFRQRLSNSTATYAANYLRDAGIRDSLVIPVETLHKIKSKTYTSALDVKTWLEKNRPGRHSIAIFTEATHARRSYLSFVKAFGDSADIGIISSTNRKMNSANWWKSLKGWSTILYETVGILYISVFV
jgi:hypothetical protein